MRFVELHDIRYTDARERMLVNLDNVTCVQENCIMLVDGRAFIVKEDFDQIKAYVRAINELECKYEKYFDKMQEPDERCPDSEEDTYFE